MKNFSVTVAISALNEAHNITAFLRSVLSQKEEGFALEKIKHGTINIKNTALILSAFFYPYDIYRTYQTNH